MINVTIGNNLKRTNIIVSEATTIRKALEDNGIDYTRGTTSLDGATLAPGQMDKTFAELGAEVKNQISHRARATQKLADFLAEET